MDMRISAECVMCILNVRAGEILNSCLDANAKLEAIRELTKYIAEVAKPGTLTTTLASLGFRKVKTLTGNEDPYLQLKIEADRAAEKAVKLLINRLVGLSDEDRFRLAAISSINANLIDPGIAGYDFSLDELREVIFNDELAIDDLHEIYRKVNTAKIVVYLLDNAGEAVFDKVLMTEIKRKGAKVYAVVKGRAYQNDVSVKDAERIGLGTVVDAILSTENDFSSLVPGTYSRKIDEITSKADLVIAKGMAHYETLSEIDIGRPVAFLLKAKCGPVAASLNVRPGSNVALLQS